MAKSAISISSDLLQLLLQNLLIELKLILAFVLEGLINTLKFRRAARIYVRLVARLRVAIVFACIPHRRLAIVFLLEGLELALGCLYQEAALLLEGSSVVLAHSSDFDGMLGVGGRTNGCLALTLINDDAVFLLRRVELRVDFGECQPRLLRYALAQALDLL